jgi:hypothetical protein
MKSVHQTGRDSEMIPTLSRMIHDLLEQWDCISIEETSWKISRLPTVMQRCIAVQAGLPIDGPARGANGAPQCGPGLGVLLACRIGSGRPSPRLDV